MVAVGTLSTKQLASLQRSTVEAGEFSLARQFHLSEVLFQLQILEKIREETRFEVGEDPVADVWLAKTRLNWIEYVDAWLRHSLRDPHERGEKPTYPESDIEPPRDLEALAWATAHVDPSRFIRAFDVSETRRRLALVALAIARHEADHGGAAPPSLDDLVPRYLDSMPLDPFTGTSFVYERRDGGYRLTASESALAAWNLEARDPVLDWSRPRAAIQRDDADAPKQHGRSGN
jgi:hypothetical protein